MSQYDAIVRELAEAPSPEAIREIIEAYPAVASREGGALYSGKVGVVHSGDFVAQVRTTSEIALIDRTPRAELLSDPDVAAAIRSRSRALFEAAGVAPNEAREMSGDFLFGSRTPGPTSVENSLWGRASADFVGSLKGDVIVLAAEADPNRVFGAVELKAALENRNITSLGGIPTDTLRAQVENAHGDLSGVLQEVQKRFREDVGRGAFLNTDDNLVLSREFADAYGMKGNFQTAAELEASGLRHVTSVEAPSRALPLPVDPARVPVGTIARGLEHANAVATVALLGYDAVRVTQQYEALAKNGNAFAANAMVREEALSTGVGFGGAILASAGAGAAYGALGGAETGPGALITGAVGGVVGGFVGAVGGSEIARKITENEINHETGADGKTYVFKDGSWKQEHWFQSDAPAPAAQVSTLDMRRTEKITDLAIANPPHPDPNTIDVVDPKTHATQTWERHDDHWQTHVRAGRGTVTLTATEASHPELTAQLNALSAQRAFIDQHGAEMAANAFVMDYYGKSWDRLGPLPQSVTTALKLPSETKIADPSTGKTWDVDGGTATREEFRHLGRGGYEATITASGDDLKRVLALRDAAVAANHRYGAELMDRSFAALSSQHEHETEPPAAAPPTKAKAQAAVDALREAGTYVANVLKLEPWNGKPQTGSFVDLGDGVVAQHAGRGVYRYMDVAEHLGGVVPPIGQTVSLNQFGQVQQPEAQAQSLSRG